MKDLRRGSGAWINMVRSSLKKLSEEDGQYLEMILTSQSSESLKYALSDSDRKKLWSSVVNSEAGQIAVSIPDDENGISNGHKVETVHTQIQASLAQIGESMGLRIWLPIADRQRILELWRPNNDNVLLTHLPLNYDNVTSVSYTHLQKHSEGYDVIDYVVYNVAEIPQNIQRSYMKENAVPVSYTHLNQTYSTQCRCLS